MAAKSKPTVFDKALHLLSYSAQSEAELRRKLLEREYGEDDIDGAVMRLKDYGYINDAELGEDLFERYRREGKYGDAYIHQKLKQRGLFVDDHLTLEEEEQRALVLLEKKEAIEPGFVHNFRRAAAFLSRRGFKTAAVIGAIDQVKE